MIKPSASLMPALYSHRVHDIQAIMRACGYCMALHGSMQRDIDVIAVPWTKKAVTPRTLVKRLCDGLDLMFDPERNPTERPHGRLAWSLHMNGAGYMDLSVMPRLLEVADDLFCVAGNHLGDVDSNSGKLFAGTAERPPENNDHDH